MKSLSLLFTNLARIIPGLALFTGINSASLRTELVAAVTVFAILAPSAMAYGDLAGVTPVAGLYVALGAMVMYALFGTSKQLILGPEATSAILTAAAVAPLAGGDPARYAALAALTAILIGVLAILGGVVRLGFITDFLSKPILVGYIAGTTLIVIASQSGKLFGITLENRDFFPQLFELVSRLDETNLLTFALGIVSILALFGIRRINRALPGPLVVVAIAIAASAAFDLAGRGVSVVGAVPAGLPAITLPSVGVADIQALLPAALALTILIYADEILTARVFAARHNQKIDPNQEFIAIGMANIGAGLVQGFPAATSSSRTVVADQMGGASQLVGLAAAALTIVFLLFFTPLLAPLPTVVLAAIIIVASFGLLDVQAFLFLRSVRRVEFRLALVTLLGVLTIGILQGILFAVTLSLINVLYRISRPHDALLDDVDVGGGVVYRGVSDKATALTEAGLVVYRFDAPRVFANASYFAQRLQELVVRAGEGLKCVILDAEAISDFDSTAAEALENMDSDLDQRGVEFWIARANEPLRELLQVTGLTKRLGKENIYPSVRAAVVAYRERFGAALDG
ncbi:MAG: SulP family inorganic anion transporter [Chloroflexi bacterium]|nr:SulP family inorganic anion transporter [Chloroflexota bacterium]